MLEARLETEVDVVYSGELNLSSGRAQAIEALKRVGLSPMGWHGEFSIRFVLPSAMIDDLPMGIGMHCVDSTPGTPESVRGAKLAIFFSKESVSSFLIDQLLKDEIHLLLESGHPLIGQIREGSYSIWQDPTELLRRIYEYLRKVRLMEPVSRHSNVYVEDPQAASGALSVFQLFSFYGAYLDNFYRNNPQLISASYADQLAALKRDNFCPWHWFDDELSKQGHRAISVVADAEILQKQWAKENKVSWREASWQIDILQAQIEKFSPDVLYIMHPLDYDTKFIKSLKKRPPLVVAWRAAEVPDGVDWSEIDLLLSHLSVIRRAAADKGAKAAHFFHPGVPSTVVNSLKNIPKSYDVVFCGQWSHHHVRRNVMIHALANAAERGDFTLGLFLAVGNKVDLPEIVRKHNRGAVWGMDMLKTLASGKIVVNAEIDLADGEAGNLRMYEATAAGSCLLTEDQINLPWYLELGKEVESYKSSHDLIEKIGNLLGDELRLRETAAYGREAISGRFGISSVVGNFIHLINQAWNRRYPESPKGLLFLSDEEQTFKEKLDSALLQIESGNNVTALEIIDSIPKRDLYIQHLAYMRSLILIESGRLWEAGLELESELVWDPTNTEVRELFDKVCNEIVHSGELPLDDESVCSDAHAILNGVTTLLSNGDGRSAMLAAERLTRQLPKLLGGQYVYSVTLAANGRIREAIQACQAEIAISGDKPELRAWMTTLQDHL